MFSGVYSGRRVLVTGDSGFKGSWLVKVLQELGAEVFGFSQPMAVPNHGELLALDYNRRLGDVRDSADLQRYFAEVSPELVFHLAAQPLVRLSYRNPAETFAANIMGTVNVLEAIRGCASVKAAVMITSDKCYENLETSCRYRETDRLGGYDPYSASKGAAEIVISSYLRSFFNPEDFPGKHEVLIASARAGNVIGGGDWALDRLIPDLVRNAAAGRETLLRSPDAVRPWQHVLEVVSGYLLLGAGLWQRRRELSGSWNFGPEPDGVLNVRQVAEVMSACWPEVRWRADESKAVVHEARLLQLDISKASEYLHWHPVWNAEEALRHTAAWYREFYRNGTLKTADDWHEYVSAATAMGEVWTGQLN